jgi:putative ABC transport system substrate-binding protein
MRELGHIEGRDYAFEERYADGNLNRLPLLAEELVSLKPDLIVAGSTPVALAVKRGTADIPIVGLLLTDPVGMGLVRSEAHPGTNVTGILLRVEGLPGKQLEIALDLVAGARKIGALIDPNNPSNEVQRQEAESAAAKLGMKLVPIEVRTGDEIVTAFQTLVREHADFVMVFTDAVYLTKRRQIAAFALASRMPTIFSDRDSVEGGGLISYGTNWRETYRRAAYYVDRILKGEKPDDLPVEFPTKVELVVNLATAKALGLTVPPNLLAIADEVIE